MPANGTWILRFEDGVAGETGQVTAAMLTLTLSGGNQIVTKAEDSNDGMCNADCSLLTAHSVKPWSLQRTGISLLSLLHFLMHHA